MALENEGDVEKMFELFIYNHMKNINLHDVAEIFAKEANIEIPRSAAVVEIKENPLTEWWEVFWPKLCSRLLNKAGVNAESSGQQMAFGKDWDKEKTLPVKNEGDAQKMLELYICDYMKKKNLHDVANIFAKEANVETSQLVEVEENLLLEWWQVFWPTFCSRTRENAESSGQATLASLENQGAGSTAQTPMEVNVLSEFSTVGGNTVYFPGEENRSRQMPLTGAEDSDGLDRVLPRTHVPAFYILLMVIYIVRTEW